MKLKSCMLYIHRVGLCCKSSREFEQYYAAVEIGGVFQ